MMKNDLISAQTGYNSAATYIARIVYRMAGRRTGKANRKALKFFLAFMPHRLSSEVTALLCREYRLRAGTQPSRDELERLAYLCAIFPSDLNLIALAFCINLYPDTNNVVIEHLLTRIQGCLHSRDDFKLMHLFYLHKNRSDKFNVQAFRDINFDSISNDNVLIDIWRIIYITCLFSRTDIYHDFDTDILENYLNIEADPNIFYSALYVIFDYFNKTYNLDKLSAVLSRTKFESSVEKFAITYFFLVSFGFIPEATALEEEHKILPSATLHPMYIKGKLAPVNICVRGIAPPSAFTIDHNYSTSSWLWRDAELQKAEIATRLQSRSSIFDLSSSESKKMHLLVAFFGQMRYPEKTLTGVRDWVLNDFSSLDEDIDITFAISTWSESGTKVFLPDGHIDTIAGFLSLETVNLLKNLGCCTISDIEKYCPRAAEKIISSTRVDNRVDENYIQRFLPEAIYSAIEKPENYMTSLGYKIIEEYDGNQMVINQGRMLSRIGAIEKILSDVDHQKTPATHILFIRPDLCDLSGSLAEQFLQIRHQKNWAIVDEDAYAHAVEGVGDRYILAERNAANRIVEIERRTKEILSAEPGVKNLRKKRLEPHQMLRSLLFENNVDVYTVSRRSVGWNLYRGDLNKETVAVELEQDIANMSDRELKKAFLAVI